MDNQYLYRGGIIKTHSNENGNLLESEVKVA